MRNRLRNVFADSEINASDTGATMAEIRFEGPNDGPEYHVVRNGTGGIGGADHAELDPSFGTILDDVVKLGEGEQFYVNDAKRSQA
ncbi:hypothetical protein [Dawidia soli]|uniref:Uncharacterized protein n=1 Tax=Dawidia soli TaxID=2782352 RepID=A0AAP2DG70_9BACT|nr:hypothetical protein [Dawidia soli]MBT1690100.1 hypothetical protein [Dawidia soli]